MTYRLLTFMYTALAVSLFAVVVFLLPSSVGWRDSGEFLISAFYSDIPHPAGFPVYSQLANAVNLLLPGPIAWRTHVFSALVVLTSLITAVQLTKEVLAGIGGQASSLLSVFVIGFSLLTAEAFWQSILKAEVYGLHALALTVVVRLVLKFLRVADVRYLYAGSFLGGVALGNHVVTSLFGVWAGVLLLFARRLTMRTAVTSFLFGCIGLTTYCYLPIRAHAPLPLNTGSPTTFSRLINQVTDARDLYLRPSASDGDSDFGSKSRLVTFPSDLIRALRELPLVSLPCIALGLYWLLITLPLPGAIFLGVPFSTLLFFSGWDSDPWIAALQFGGVLAAVGAHFLYESIIKCMGLLRQVALAALLIGLSSIGIQGALSINRHVEISPSTSAITTVTSALRSGQVTGIAITDASWFLTRYAQYIEGIQPYLVTLYSPSILFPGFFNPAEVRSPKGVWKASPLTSIQEPAITNLFSLLNQGPEVFPITLEPNEILLAPLAEIVQLTANGTMVVRHNENGAVDPNFLPTIYAQLSSLARAAQSATPAESSDIDEHLRILIAQYAQSFLAIKKPELLLQLCSFSITTELLDKRLPKTSSAMEAVCW